LLSDDEENASQDGNNDENSKSSFSNSNSSNQLLKRGQELLRKNLLTKTMQMKRTSNDEITSFGSTTSRLGAMSVTLSSTSTTTKSSITIQSIESSKKQPDDSVDIMNKFSFLNRDKSYLSRLSNYVNKNLAHAGTGNAKAGGRSNNMIFTSVNSNDNEVLESAATNEDDGNNFAPLSKVREHDIREHLANFLYLKSNLFIALKKL
jgi:hypothetical protein